MTKSNPHQKPLKEKNIGLDLKALSLQNAGIGRYTINLTQELIKRNRYSYTAFYSPSTEQKYIENKQLKIAKGISFYFNSTMLRSLALLPFQVEKEKIDLFHSMDNSTIHLLPFSTCKRLSTIHDVIVFRRPEFFTRKHVTVVRKMTTYSVNNADHIIADSYFTKKDLLEIFPNLRDQDISVIHLAASACFKKRPQIYVQHIIKKYNLPQRYFLSLATQEPRKNLKNLIKAFKLFRQKTSFDDIGLVLVGGRGWLHSGTEDAKNKEENIFRLGFLDDEILPHLYSGALAFVYPSFYEGFGLPVLEAMSCGSPIITSQNSSLPEIAGESAIYIDPHSIDSIKSALQQITDSKFLLENLSKNAIQKSSEFSWENTAEQTEAVYKSLLY